VQSPLSIGGIVAHSAAYAGEYRGTWGTADGLQAGCLASVQRPDPGWGPHRRLPAAEHAATLRWLPRGVRIQQSGSAATATARAARTSCAVTDLKQILAFAG